ncbi:MAG: VanZ family protein [Oscillospiraceae bacterium]|nr:VanZ family protein [Oscillospiraceae bacterium]
MKRRGQGILTLCTILVVLFIWIHSMIPAVYSSQESSAVLVLLMKLFEKLGISAVLTEHIVRKTAHFLEYMLLGILMTGTVTGRKGRGSRSFLGLALLTVPFVDETIQLFVEGRSGQLQDVWLDLAGCCAGVLLWTGARAVILHKKMKG